LNSGISVGCGTGLYEIHLVLSVLRRRPTFLTTHTTVHHRPPLMYWRLVIGMLRLCASFLTTPPRITVHHYLTSSIITAHYHHIVCLFVSLRYWPFFTSNRVQFVSSLTSLLLDKQDNLASNVMPEFRNDSAAGETFFCGAITMPLIVLICSNRQPHILITPLYVN
jgi:hypothetical protein